MKVVECELIFDQEESSDGALVDIVIAICSKCRHFAKSYGAHDNKAIMRSLTKLHDTCPIYENNLYVGKEEGKYIR